MTATSLAERQSGGGSAYDRLYGLVADDLKAVDDLIRQRMASRHSPLIPQLADYLVGAGGKRIRPMLTLAAAQMCGGDGANPVRLAAAVELIHSATLLHDDVVDESQRRRGRASANLIHGNKPCILVGDYLFSRSFQLMVETGSIQVLDILSDASAVIAEGEVLQLSTAGDVSTTEEQYLQVIRGKTAALFSASTEAGAIVVGAAPAQSAALRDYGDALGIAFQLVDDLLDYGGTSSALGKDVGDDFREGKATLPILLAHQRGDDDERAFWRRVIDKRQQVDGDLERALELMTRTGALAETRDRADASGELAIAALQGFPDSPVRQAMTDIVRFVTDRAH